MQLTMFHFLCHEFSRILIKFFLPSFISKDMLKILTVTVFISANVNIISVCVPSRPGNSDLQDVVINKLSTRCLVVSLMCIAPLRYRAVWLPAGRLIVVMNPLSINEFLLDLGSVDFLRRYMNFIFSYL
jgi:hypothetical protein